MSAARLSNRSSQLKGTRREHFHSNFFLASFFFSTNSLLSFVELAMATATMQLEIDVATNFLLSFAYSKIPRAQADNFKREFTRTLLNLYSGHWYPNNPSRGSAYRSLSVSDRMDPSIQRAASSSGIDLIMLREHLPKNMTMWIDPYEVSYRIGERGEITTLWQQQQKQQSSNNRTNSSAEGSYHRDNRRSSTQQYRGRSSPRSHTQHRWFQTIDQEAETYVGSADSRSSPSWVQWSTAESFENTSYGPRRAFDSRSSSPTYSSGSLSSSSDDDSDVQTSRLPIRPQQYYVTYRGEVYNTKALRSGYGSSRNVPHTEHLFSSPRREITVSS